MEPNSSTDNTTFHAFFSVDENNLWLYRYYFLWKFKSKPIPTRQTLQQKLNTFARVIKQFSGIFVLFSLAEGLRQGKINTRRESGALCRKVCYMVYFLLYRFVFTVIVGCRQCLSWGSTSRVRYSVRCVSVFLLGGNGWCFCCDSRLPIVLFVGQHFSGSLFCAITLLLLSRETTKGTRVRDLSSP